MTTFSQLKFLTLPIVFFSIFSSYCYGNMVSVGDAYEGGTVFCVDPNPDPTKCNTANCLPIGKGHCGLIMSNEDQVNLDSPNKGVTWASKYEKTGAQSDDDGAANTAAIIAAHPKDNPGNNAAWLCRSYRGGDKEDWYLPAKDELNKLYLFAKASNLIGKGCAGARPGLQCLVGGYNDDGLCIGVLPSALATTAIAPSGPAL